MLTHKSRRICRRLYSRAPLISGSFCKLVAYIGAEFKFNIVCRIYRLRLVRLASDLRVASYARTVSSHFSAQALNFTDWHGVRMFENSPRYLCEKLRRFTGGAQGVNSALTRVYFCKGLGYFLSLFRFCFLASTLIKLCG